MHGAKVKIKKNRWTGLWRCRSQWPRGLRRRSAAARLLRSWVRIPPGAWIFVCCECRVLSGRVLWDELIARPGVLPTVVRLCVWSRNIKNRCSIYIYDISSLRVKLVLVTSFDLLSCSSKLWKAYLPTLLHRSNLVISTQPLLRS